MKEDLISVIVPVYNAEKHLNKCIESLLNQTHNNLEIILIDDKSKDNSKKICKYYENKDKRIKVLSNEKNLGQAATRNRGLEYAKGEFIGFVDDDDFLDERFYEVLLHNLKENKADISGCATSTYYSDDRIVNTYSNLVSGFISKEKAIMDIFYQTSNSWGTVWNKIFSKKYKEKLRFKEGVELEDYLVILKIFNECDSIYFDSRPLYYYRQRNDSQSKRGYHPNIQTEKIVVDELKEYFTEHTDKKEIIQALSYFDFYIRYGIVKNMYKSSKEIKKEKFKEEITELIRKKYKIKVTTAYIKKRIRLWGMYFTMTFKKYK